jgi:excisionase family DNA binding protein
MGLNKSYMKVNELAEFLDISENTIYRLIKKGELSCLRIGTAIRFEKSYIENWCKNKTS